MSSASSAPRCPNCGKPPQQTTRPFCSRRCANIDLHRWLSGVYSIPVTEDTDEDGKPSIAPDQLND
jgi:hypothetical protein